MQMFHYRNSKMRNLAYPGYRTRKKRNLQLTTYLEPHLNVIIINHILLFTCKVHNGFQLPHITTETPTKHKLYSCCNLFLCTAIFKPYKSSYNHTDLPQTEGKNTREYYCEVCDKQLNGPKPYSAHMVSKAHKEMVEYVNS